ncbi:hypothetical protein [Luteolibacter sp. LG18]|uniref:hypothetical protein n=1 Tax=Luteolibacter sp. LG18 TaxID=2819286 RepID=UPI002B2D4019|nr:hypothetical protein llg_06950 [Luteolibacter sp. LG18]BCU79676.1 hypothetical protein llg_43910 [Luteolibacter sp. LG18]
MGQDLSTKKPASDEQTFKWLLHNSGDSLATGYRVSLGDGSDLPLWLKTGQIGFYNAGGVLTKFDSAATQTRVVTFQDADGMVFPDTYKIQTADVTVSNTGLSTAIDDLEFTPLANGRYEFEVWAMVQSAATTTGVVISMTGPTVTQFVWEVRGPSTSASAPQIATGNGFTVTFNGTAIPAANTPQPLIIRGSFLVTGSPGAPVKVVLNTEVNGSAVKMLTGSYARFRRIG